jgi:dipeptidyl aminopeptidase/acylaminoacyl peptidase
MEKRPSAELLGVENVYDNQDLARRASCLTYIEKGIKLPPVLLIHGDQDTVVTVEHSRRLYRALDENMNSVAYYELQGSSHGGAAFWTERVMEIIDKFISHQAASW